MSFTPGSNLYSDKAFPGHVAGPAPDYITPVLFGALGLAIKARPFLRKVIDASKAGASAAKSDWTKD